MSVTYTTYLMLGARIPQDEFPNNVWDDEWLPYYEGHEGVEMRLLLGEGESGQPVYAGKVLAEWNRFSGDGFTEIALGDLCCFGDLLDRVKDFLVQLDTDSQPKLLFFTLVS